MPDRSSDRTRAEPVTPRRCRRISGRADGSIIAAIISVHVPRKGANAPTTIKSLTSLLPSFLSCRFDPLRDILTGQAALVEPAVIAEQAPPSPVGDRNIDPES